MEELFQKSSLQSRLLFVAIGAAASVLFILFHNAGNDKESVGDVIITSVSGKTETLLTDGTEVYLRGHSYITYPSNFNEGQRKLSLSGEAFFNVAKNPGKPFTVQVGEYSVNVLGTVFGITDNNNTLSVGLLDGSVSLFHSTLDDKGNPVSKEIARLEPGHKTLIDKSSGNTVICREDVFAETVWIKDKLSFENRTVGDVCKLLSGWYGINVVAEKSIEDKYAYTFTITGESLERILDLICKVNPLQYAFATGDTVLITTLKK